MNSSPLKESDYFVAWIIFFVVALIGGVVAGFVGGVLVGVILADAGASREGVQIAGAIVGFILGLPVSYVCFRFIVAKFIVQKIQDTARVQPPTYVLPQNPA
jgi:hypothetical protein